MQLQEDGYCCGEQLSKLRLKFDFMLVHTDKIIRLIEAIDEFLKEDTPSKKDTAKAIPIR